MTTPLRRAALPGSPPRSKPKHRVRGVTLIELLCTISIVAVLSAIAVPQLRQIHRAAVQRAAISDFFHSLYLARTQAIMNNAVVSICRSHDGAHCANQDGRWQDGWIVFENTDRDQPADRDLNEEIIYRHNGWQGGVITSNRLSFSFRPTSQGDVNGTVVFCALRGSAREARAIIINHAGRPRISTRDASNHALECPRS